MARQLTCFQFEIGTMQMVKAEDGRYDMVKTPICVVEDTSLTKTAARAALREEGFETPRNLEIYWEKIGRVQYRFSTEALKSIAEERVELPL